MQRMDKRGDRPPLASPPSPPRPQAPRARTRCVLRRSDRGTSMKSSSLNGQPRDRYSLVGGHAGRRLCNGWTNEGNTFLSLVRRRHHVHKHHEYVDGSLGALRHATSEGGRAIYRYPPPPEHPWACMPDGGAVGVCPVEWLIYAREACPPASNTPTDGPW